MRFAYVLLFGFNLMMEIKMTDSEHLAWIVGRLINVHGENPSVDYMIRLQEIAHKLDLPVGKALPPKSGSKVELNEAGYNLHFAGDKTDEWPKVGDEVLTSFGVGELKLGKDSNGTYIVEVDGRYYMLTINAIKKPKTEAEILRDDIATQLEAITGNTLSKSGTWLQSISLAMVENKISGIEITKKPQ